MGKAGRQASRWTSTLCTCACAYVCVHGNVDDLAPCLHARALRSERARRSLRHHVVYGSESPLKPTLVGSLYLFIYTRYIGPANQEVEVHEVCFSGRPRSLSTPGDGAKKQYHEPSDCVQLPNQGTMVNTLGP